MANPDITPVTIIGGFLGAGKTTLLNKLLSEDVTSRCAVLVNDFGDVAVDASLIKSRDANTISLKNGCICCSIGNDLGTAISQTLNFKPQPHRIMIEASGVSHPGRIMDVAKISKELSPGGIYVLADAAAIASQLEDRWIADTVSQQLESADYIVTSKMENLIPKQQMAVYGLLSDRCPKISLLNTTDINWSHIESHRTRNNQSSSTTLHAHFKSHTLRSSKSLDLKKLRSWLITNSGIYRVKGWFVDQHDGRVKLLQAVDHRISVSESSELIEDKFIVIVIGNEQLPEPNHILEAISEL